MPLSRRLLLFLPLVGLTLFFGACGWRNWHLERDINGVWMEGIAYGLAHVSPKAQVQMYGARPDQLEEVRELMKKQFPQQKALDWGWNWNTFPSRTVVQVLEAKVHSRFHATAYCVYDENGKHGSEFLVLTRSPLKFWDNSWHVARAEMGRPPGYFYRAY